MDRLNELLDDFQASLDGLTTVLAVVAVIAFVIWGGISLFLWLRSRPRLPRPGPQTQELFPEPPAVANFLVHGWKVTHAAATATVVDLAARHYLGLEDYAGDNHVVRIRSNQPEGQPPLNRYEQQVFDLVKSRATGGSMPLQALDLGESSSADSWWKRFRSNVEADAKDRGLARPRWRGREGAVISGGLLVVLQLVALVLVSAGVEEANRTTDDDFSRWDWPLVAFVAWGALLVLFSRARTLTTTGAGKEACANWLGSRDYLRATNTFGDLPPGSVVIWERYLAYAAAFGIAHDVSMAIPLDADDPELAWSRYTGQWRSIDVSYPKRWGYGRKPLNVFFEGLGLAAFWGFIGFFVLPIAIRITLELIRDIPDGLAAENEPGERQLFWLGTAIISVFAIFGVYVAYNFVRGMARLILVIADAGKTKVIEGPVVCTALGRVVIDDGVSDEARAWTPPPGSPPLGRGTFARVTMTPRLHWVTAVEIVPEHQPPAPGYSGVPA